MAAPVDAFGGLLLLAHDKEIGHLVGLCAAHFLAEGFGGVVHLRAHQRLAEQRRHLVAVFAEGLGHREHAHLHGRQPGGEDASVVLDEQGDEALVGAQRRAVDDVRAVAAVIRAHIGQVEALGHDQIELVGGGGLLPPHHVPDLEIHLGPVKRRLAPHRLVGNVHLIHGGDHHPLGLRPCLAAADVLFAGVQIRQGEAHPVVGDPELLVVELVQAHHGDELVRGLLLRAIDVRIVHRHGPHAQQPRQLAGLFVAVARPVLGQAQRQIAVAAGLGLVDHVVVGAVHRLEVIGAVVRLHGRKHVRGEVGQVARGVVQPLLGDVRRGHPLVAVAELRLLGQRFQLVPDHRTVGHPQHQPLAHLLGDGEQTHLLAQLAVVARLGQLAPVQEVLQLGLAGEGQPVDPLQHLVLLVPAPVGARQGVQLEAVGGKLSGGRHVVAPAHIREGADGVHAERILPLRLEVPRHIRLVDRSFGLETRDQLVGGELLAGEGLVRRDDAPHALLHLLQLLLAQGRLQVEIIEEAVLGGRPVAQLRGRTQLQHRLGQHVGKRVPQAVQRGFGIEMVAVHGSRPCAVGECGRCCSLIRRSRICVNAGSAPRRPASTSCRLGKHILSKRREPCAPQATFPPRAWS